MVISGINAAKGAIAIYDLENDRPAAATIHYSSYIIDKQKVVPTYLWYFLRSDFFRKILIRSLPKGIKTEVKPARFLNLEIPLPCLEDQKNIVSKIENLLLMIDEVMSLHRRSIEESEALVNAEILSTFEKGKESGWAEQPLGAYVVDSCYGTSEKANDDASGTPVLRMGNIQNGRLDLQDLKYLHLSEKDRGKLILKKGDILVNRTNSAELVGKCAVFDLEGEYAFASYLIRLRIDVTRAEPKLVAWYINSPAGRAYMFSERKQMTGQANVNAAKLKALPIALPSIPEQRRIIDRLDSLQKRVDEIRRLQDETKKEMEELFPSILDQEFKGKLREVTLAS